MIAKKKKKNIPTKNGCIQKPHSFDFDHKKVDSQ